jgi:blocked early in transport 1
VRRSGRDTLYRPANQLPTPNRFGASSLHQRDSRSALFEGYTGDQTRRGPSASPGSGYGFGGYQSPGGSNTHLGVENKGFRPATPNRRGQYSDAVLNELESQNDAQVEGILGKVKVLKDVSFTDKDTTSGGGLLERENVLC